MLLGFGCKAEWNQTAAAATLGIEWVVRSRFEKRERERLCVLVGLVTRLSSFPPSPFPARFDVVIFHAAQQEVNNHLAAASAVTVLSFFAIQFAPSPNLAAVVVVFLQRGEELRNNQVLKRKNALKRVYVQ